MRGLEFYRQVFEALREHGIEAARDAVALRLSVGSGRALWWMAKPRDDRAVCARRDRRTCVPGPRALLAHLPARSTAWRCPISNAGVTLEDERDRAAVTAAFSHHMFMASARAVESCTRSIPQTRWVA